MIKNVVFDIGNVLTDYTWNKYIHSFGFAEEVCERVAAATVKSKEWAEFDRGVMSVEAVVETLVKNDPGIEKEIREFTADMSGLVEKVDYAIPWIQELKAKGYGVYYLSNFSEKAEKECAHALDFIPYTDGGILSYRDKMVKPEPEIYKCFLERYHLKAEECVFLDDLETNINAARAQGMHGIVFTTREAAVADLEKLGVK